MTIESTIFNIASIDLFKKGPNPEMFVGRPFSLGYESAYDSSFRCLET